MNTNIKLIKHTFIDGDFSMEINVSEEERTIYMSQKEIAELLGVGLGTVSKKLKKMVAKALAYFPKFPKMENMVEHILLSIIR